jgi:hypothetical protein
MFIYLRSTAVPENREFSSFSGPSRTSHHLTYLIHLLLKVFKMSRRNNRDSGMTSDDAQRFVKDIHKLIRIVFNVSKFDFPDSHLIN